MKKLGSKAENLIQLRDIYRVAVPDFIALPFEDIFQNFDQLAAEMVAAVDAYLNDQSELSETEQKLSQLLEQISINEQAILKYEQELSGYGKVSFRTSALLEDLGTDSFAGQYESFLDIDFSMPALREHAIKCFSSMLSAQVLTYSKQRGIRHFLLAGSVIVQKMFYGSNSGVLFTENGSGELQLAITNSWRNTVVEGEDAKELRIPRFELGKADIPNQLRQLCEASLRIEAAVGRPIDVEWAYNKQGIAFLQYRPITQPMLEYRF